MPNITTKSIANYWRKKKDSKIINTKESDMFLSITICTISINFSCIQEGRAYSTFSMEKRSTIISKELNLFLHNIQDIDTQNL